MFPLRTQLWKVFAARLPRFAAIVGVVLFWFAWHPFAVRAQEESDFDDPSVVSPDDAAEWNGQWARTRHRTASIGNLTHVLDELLPDTAAPRTSDAPRDEVARLIEALGDDSFRVRETASAKLMCLGEGICKQLAEATKSDNAERSWRATRILRGWENRKYEDKSRLLPAFASYCEGISDDARLEEIARRLRVAMANHIESNSRREAMRQCMTVLLRSGKQEYDDLLRPCLKGADLQAAYMVVDAAGRAMEMGQGRSMPKLLLEAMQNDHEDLAMVAINFTTNCNPAARNEELKQTLLAIFAGNRENLKFQVAQPLMRIYSHPAASDYVIEQAQGDDPGRRCTAIIWLMADGSAQSEPTKRVLDLLTSLLQHKDPQTRRIAVMSLSSYSSEEVVKRLIPVLGDKDANVAQEVIGRLMNQSDKAMLRRLLNAAVQDKSQKNVSRMAQRTLDQLDQMQRDAGDDDADVSAASVFSADLDIPFTQNGFGIAVPQ